MDDEQARSALFPVPESMCSMYGFGMDLYLSSDLADRLEVPDEWQPDESFWVRLSYVLASLRSAIKLSNIQGCTFKVVIPSNLTHHPEELMLRLDIAEHWVIELT